MNDRELLEIAAKAFGYKNYFAHHLGRYSFVTYEDKHYSMEKECHVVCEKTLDWNPLEDDGDALRLAVRLNLAVVLHPALNQAIVRPYHTRDMNRECREDCEKHTDHFAATRRAIVRAAAEIGRQMQEGGAA